MGSKQEAFTQAIAKALPDLFPTLEKLALARQIAGPDFVSGWNMAIEAAAKRLEGERGDRQEIAARAREIRDLSFND